MKPILAFALITIATMPAFAGKRIIAVMTRNGVSQRLESRIEGSRMKTINPSEGTVLFLTDNDHLRFVTLNVLGTEYTVSDAKSTLETARKLQEIIDRERENFDRSLLNLSAERQAELKGSFHPLKFPKYEVVPVGDDVVKNIPCHRVQWRLDGRATQELCLASPGDLGLSPGDAAVFESMRRYGAESDKILSAFPDLPNAFAARYPGYGGLSIRTIYFEAHEKFGEEIYEEGKKIGEQILESIEDANFPDADFDIGNAKRVEFFSRP